MIFLFFSLNYSARIIIFSLYISCQCVRDEQEMLSLQVDAARILVDKLITENAELIGKVIALL